MTFELPAPLRRFRRRVLWHTRWGDLTGGLLFDLGSIIAGTLCMALSVVAVIYQKNEVASGFPTMDIIQQRILGWTGDGTMLSRNQSK